MAAGPIRSLMTPMGHISRGLLLITTVLLVVLSRMKQVMNWVQSWAKDWGINC